MMTLIRKPEDGRLVSQPFPLGSNSGSFHRKEEEGAGPTVMLTNGWTESLPSLDTVAPYWSLTNSCLFGKGPTVVLTNGWAGPLLGSSITDGHLLCPHPYYPCMVQGGPSSRLQASCVLTWWKGRALSGASFVKELIPFMRTPPPWLKAITLGIRISPCEVWWGTQTYRQLRSSCYGSAVMDPWGWEFNPRPHSVG